MSNLEPPRAWLLLRGLGRETGHWFEFVDLLSRSLGVPAIGVDLPGVGRAGHRPVPLHVGGMARDVAGRLDETRLGSSFGVLAISLGSMVALSLAEQVPSRVERLVLINPSTRLSSPRQRLRPQAAFTLVRGALNRDPEARERIYYGLTSNAAGAELERLAARAARLAEHHPVARRALLRQILAAARFSAPHIEQPTLILSARGDRLVSPDCSEALAHFLGARHEQHPSAGHDLPLEAGDWIIERIVEWLPSVGEPARPDVQSVSNQRS